MATALVSTLVGVLATIHLEMVVPMILVCLAVDVYNLCICASCNKDIPAITKSPVARLD